MSRYHAAGGRAPASTARALLAESDVCWICGRPGSTTVDHIIPLALGGTSDRVNLAPAHLRCNSARGLRALLAPSRIARPGPAIGGSDE